MRSPDFGRAFFVICIYIEMLKLVKGTTATIYVTLKEKQTILDANFLFVFQSRTTNEKVKFVLVNSADQSLYQDRYNEFDIVVNTYFSSKEEGWYTYKVYEQASSSNVDESLAGSVVETGLMFLADTDSVNTTTYNNNTTFKVYDAE
jgi:hypothetical protein